MLQITLFFCKQKTAYVMLRSLVVSDMGIRNRKYAEPEPFRFDIGARVECYGGDGEDEGWCLGTVIAHHFRAPEWPQQGWTPYQVELDQGFCVCVPADDDSCIRAAHA